MVAELAVTLRSRLHTSVCVPASNVLTLNIPLPVTISIFPSLICSHATTFSLIDSVCPASIRLADTGTIGKRRGVKSKHKTMLTVVRINTRRRIELSNRRMVVQSRFVRRWLLTLARTWRRTAFFLRNHLWTNRCNGGCFSLLFSG